MANQTKPAAWGAPVPRADAAANKPPAESVGTVKMIRDAEQYLQGPYSADVHPYEVENWKAGGWTVAE